MNLVEIVSLASSLGVGGVFGFLCRGLIARSRCQIIAIFGTEIPDELAHLPVYTSYTKAKHCRYDLAILLVRNLSFGLRKCDFVVTNAASDPKVITPDNHARLSALVRNEAHSVD